MTDWQPIETAPKDGTEILIFNHCHLWGDEQQCVVGKWDGVGWYESWANEYAIMEATHWMPLPQPPVAMGGKEE